MGSFLAGRRQQKNKVGEMLLKLWFEVSGYAEQPEPLLGKEPVTCLYQPSCTVTIVLEKDRVLPDSSCY